MIKKKSTLQTAIDKINSSHVNEEVPANAVGGGNVAGLGVGSQGEPGVNKKKKFVMNFKDYIKRKALETK